MSFRINDDGISGGGGTFSTPIGAARFTGGRGRGKHGSPPQGRGRGQRSPPASPLAQHAAAPHSAAAGGKSDAMKAIEALVAGKEGLLDAAPTSAPSDAAFIGGRRDRNVARESLRTGTYKLRQESERDRTARRAAEASERLKKKKVREEAAKDLPTDAELDAEIEEEQAQPFSDEKFESSVPDANAEFSNEAFKEGAPAANAEFSGEVFGQKAAGTEVLKTAALLHEAFDLAKVHSMTGGKMDEGVVHSMLGAAAYKTSNRMHGSSKLVPALKTGKMPAGSKVARTPPAKLALDDFDTKSDDELRELAERYSASSVHHRTHVAHLLDDFYQSIVTSAQKYAQLSVRKGFDEFSAQSRKDAERVAYYVMVFTQNTFRSNGVRVEVYRRVVRYLLLTILLAATIQDTENSEIVLFKARDRVRDMSVDVARKHSALEQELKRRRAIEKHPGYVYSAPAAFINCVMNKLEARGPRPPKLPDVELPEMTLNEVMSGLGMIDMTPPLNQASARAFGEALITYFSYNRDEPGMPQGLAVQTVSDLRNNVCARRVLIGFYAFIVQSLAGAQTDSDLIDALYDKDVPEPGNMPSQLIRIMKNLHSNSPDPRPEFGGQIADGITFVTVEPHDEFVYPDGEHDFNQDVDPVPGPLGLQREGKDYTEIDPDPTLPSPANQPTDRPTLIKRIMNWIGDFKEKPEKPTKASLGGSDPAVASSDGPLLFIVPKDDAALSKTAKEWEALATGMPLTLDLLPEYLVANIGGKFLNMHGKEARPAMPRETGHVLGGHLQFYIGDEL